MLGRVTVPILPYQRRGAVPISGISGTVTIYNAMGDGSPAVDERGVVATGAITAYAYADRQGSAFPNPATFDEVGGPIDRARGGASIPFSFFAVPGVYHLLVVMPNGQRFGLPYVQAPPSDLPAYTRDLTSLYSNGTLPTLFQIPESPDPARITPDFSGAQFYGMTCPPSSPNAAIWVGENFTTNSIDDPFDRLRISGGSTGGFFSRPSVADAIHWNDNATGATAGMRTGLALGSQAVANMVTNPPDPCVALYARWDVPRWELLVAPGANAAGVVTVLSGVTAPVLHQQHHIRITYMPGAFVTASIDGVDGPRVFRSDRDRRHGSDRLVVLLPPVYDVAPVTSHTVKVGDVVGAVCWAGKKRPAIVLAVFPVMENGAPTGAQLVNIVTVSPHDTAVGPYGREVRFFERLPRTDQAADRMGWTWDADPSGPVKVRP